LVFKNFKETTEWPKEYKWKVYWIDWGFSNSPTSFGEIRFAHGEIFVKDLIYETGLTNQDICAKLRKLEIDKRDEIIADSAEPKSIEEVYRAGFNIKPSIKGTDSVRAGIDKLQEYKINIYRSPNTMAEFSNYVWKVDKNNKSLNVPIDAWNHSIDGIRGAIFTFLDLVIEPFPEQNKGTDNPELERKAKMDSAGLMEREF
jgi:phage terminase large subunit